MKMKYNTPLIISKLWKIGSPVRTLVEGSGISYAAEKTI
jgi:hypothetical protein